MVNKLKILVFDRITGAFTALFLLIPILAALWFCYPSYYMFFIAFILSDSFLLIFIYTVLLKASLHRFSLKYYAQIWVYDGDTKKTTQFFSEYKEDEDKSILIITPQKQRNNFLKKLSEDKGLPENERQNYAKAYALLSKLKEKNAYEEDYYVVFLKKMVVVAPMFFIVETSRLCGMAVERVFVTVKELCDFDTNSVVAVHPKAEKKLEQGFLIKDLTIALYFVKQQLKESVRVEAAEAIKMGQLQAIRSVHEAQQSVEISRPRRRWELTGETVKEKGLGETGRNVLYLITIAVIIISIIIAWGVMF